VLTHRNRFRVVTHVSERENREPLVQLSLTYLDEPIRCTPDHHFLAVDGQGHVDWVAARDLTNQYYVRMGRTTDTIPLDELDLSDIWMGAHSRTTSNVSTPRPLTSVATELWV